ncbi:hypothetical protein GLYMA_15G102150v4 [Glycine max]|nr:hypothetical protein GLYMA_15G102150v4 [Glycine max]KAH1146519.1 hypothetical protein GYH30_041924 [Glycine max]
MISSVQLLSFSLTFLPYSSVQCEVCVIHSHGFHCFQKPKF